MLKFALIKLKICFNNLFFYRILIFIRCPDGGSLYITLTSYDKQATINPQEI